MEVAILGSGGVGQDLGLGFLGLGHEEGRQDRRKDPDAAGGGRPGIVPGHGGPMVSGPPAFCQRTGQRGFPAGPGQGGRPFRRGAVDRSL